jgi:glutathione S-transferase
MKLYGPLLSPFARKVALVLAEKGIAFEFGRGGPGQPEPEFLAVSPFGKIPAIDDDGFTLSDSTAIALYLDAKVAEPALLPADAQGRGKAIWFDEFADTIFGAAAIKMQWNRLVGPKILKVGGDEAIALQGEAEMPRILDYLESVVPADGWLLGAQFTLADISVASFVRTLDYIGQAQAAAARPRLAAWYARIGARPAWQMIAAKEDKMMEKILARIEA